VTRLLAAFLGALLLGLSAPAAAADKNVKLTLDGRPVDRNGGIALARGGVVYADAVDLVKSFGGLLTFQGSTLVVTIGSTTARFTIGSRTAALNEGSAAMPGQVFLRNGDFYVPLDFFITRVAGAKVKIDRSLARADISVSSSPAVGPSPGP
jgi:copper amine oxidase-like protein